MLRLPLKFFILYSFVGFRFWSLLGPNGLEYAICIGNILFLGFLYTYACIKKCIVVRLFSKPPIKKTALYYFWEDLRNICISPIISLNNNTSRYLHYKIVCETEFFFSPDIYIFLGCSMYIFFRLIISPWVKVLDIS